MKKIVTLLMLAILLVGIAAPVYADEEQEDDHHGNLSSCQTQSNALQNLFWEFDLWEYVNVPYVFPSDPEHDLIHNIGETGMYRGLRAFQMPFPSRPSEPLPWSSDYDVMRGCHDYDIPIVCAVCVKYQDSDREDHEPICVKWRYYICTIHRAHCG